MAFDTIYQLFKKNVDKNPGAPAIIENGRILTFARLSSMVDVIAKNLGDVKSVGIIQSHGANMIASIFAVLKRGALYIPAEPNFPTGRIHDMMTEGNVDFVLTESCYTDLAEGFDIRLIEDVFGENGDDFGANSDAKNLKKNADFSSMHEASPDDPAYVLYTSGTTGRPKGVCVRNRNVCHYVRAFENEFHPRPGDIMLQYSVCSFDIFVEEVFASLLNGAALAIPTEDDKKDINVLMDFVTKHGVTMISGFPYLLWEMNYLEKIPKSLRLLISGGDVLRASYVDHLVEQTTVYNTYGPSETTVCAAYYHCHKDDVLDDGTYPIGKPVKGVDIRIMDNNGMEVSRGETGEICILGDGVSMGYIGDHAEENKAFVTLDNGRVMYRSGDLGYLLSDGNLAFLRRKDNQIMIYGRRVEIAEVESRLYQCENVSQAVVRALKDKYDLYYMVAYIVSKDGSLDVEKVKSELRKNLPQFMIPEFFMKVDSIPLTPNGKPDLEKLPIIKKGDYSR